MRHLTRDDGLVVRLLRRARTVAIVGASPRPERPSYTISSYLAKAGYDVIPVRPDRAPVAGLQAFASLDEVPGPVYLVVVFRRPDAVPALLDEVAEVRPEAVWLQPGAGSREAAGRAEALDLVLIQNRCIQVDHTNLLGSAGRPPGGHPAKLGRAT